jgi:hypothetical protein
MTRTVKVKDSRQRYTYVCTAAIGKGFADDFKPELSPREMLELGIFGGTYFEGEYDEFPAEWFKSAKLSDEYDKNCNYYKVKASQPLKEWQRKGWIHDEDPRGWFQWYCRYYLGRRIEDDVRQIKRWKNMTRHVGQVKAHCEPGDQMCRPVQRQALLHWAYDSRKL